MFHPSRALSFALRGRLNPIARRSFASYEGRSIADEELVKQSDDWVNFRYQKSLQQSQSFYRLLKKQIFVLVGFRNLITSPKPVISLGERLC